MSESGRIVIISSPSGGGKTSICRGLLTADRREQGWEFSISYTTRAHREGELNGREYHFVDDTEFEKLVAEDFFAEHFKVHRYSYGTPRKPLERVRDNGGVMLLDVDIQGAQRLKREYPDAISIFVLPPSVVELRKRLQARGTETEEQLKVRFENATREMSDFWDHNFDYVVINSELSVAIEQVMAIIIADSTRVDRVDRSAIERITGLDSR